MFHDDGNRIRLLVQRREQRLVRRLRHRPFGQFLVVAEKFDRIFQVRRREFMCHACIFLLSVPFRNPHKVLDCSLFIRLSSFLATCSNLTTEDLDLCQSLSRCFPSTTRKWQARARPSSAVPTTNGTGSPTRSPARSAGSPAMSPRFPNGPPCPCTPSSS